MEIDQIDSQTNKRMGQLPSTYQLSCKIVSMRSCNAKIFAAMAERFEAEYIIRFKIKMNS